MHSKDLRTAQAHESSARPKVRRVVRLADLRAESADDVHVDYTVQTARDMESPREAAAIKPEVQGNSEFRLAWLWVEGWRAQLRKAGDLVEKERWEWRVDDLLLGEGQGRNIARRPEMVSAGSVHGRLATRVNRNLDSTARDECNGGDGNGNGPRKRVRWQDSG